MKRPHEKESTRQLRRAHDSVRSALSRHKRGQVDEQFVKDELFRHRDAIAPALERSLRRVTDSRKWARNARPVYPGRAAQTLTIVASPIPVKHTIQHKPNKRGIVPGVPNKFRYIHAICLYVIRKRKPPNRGWTLQTMSNYLTVSGVLTEDGKVWSVERLTEALNPSEAWEMLRSNNVD
ncbi:hypothetical protein AOQ73_05650 [Bradyrhizobium pachyrhizi]|uniref:hypothetical protein n=1 Tax=Bradyrhizobium pachyrhizi TaxID=280333 RepID=UPI000713DB06|nr:hypothetical protein [Bradyrhizobium pachyrhizi]KRQ11891.1 hypothetical protein AOQ73_05650 [Bradyrhizobium pachyrhizi]